MPDNRIFSNSNRQKIGENLVYTQENASPYCHKGFERFEIDHNTTLNFPTLQNSENHFRRIEKWSLKSVVAWLLPKSRQSKCRRYIRPHLSALELHKKDNSAFYSGLEVCGSVWLCPCCAARISEYRKEELKRALDEAKSQGLYVSMLTLTIPHYMGDDLELLTDSLQKAYRKLFHDTAGKKWLEKWRTIGRIRALEVTHGNNGFHPHIHVLVFSEVEILPLEAENELFDHWVRCCQKYGLGEPNRRHGISVQDGSFAAQYVGKWGLEHEMTKSHIKRAKGSSMFDMLRRLIENSQDKEAIAIFLQYAKAFKGRRQLVWTKGLKERLLVDDVDDIAIAEDGNVQEAELFSYISFDEWQAVLTMKAETFLLYLSENKPDEFHDALKAICDCAESIWHSRGNDPRKKRHAKRCRSSASFTTKARKEL